MKSVAGNMCLRRIVLLENDPLLRVLRAAQIDGFAPAEFSAIVADSLYSLAATPQDVTETLTSYSDRYRVWHTLVDRLAQLEEKAPDVALTTNLFTGLFAAGELQHASDLEKAWTAWLKARKKIPGVLHRESEPGTPARQNMLHNMSCAPRSQIQHRSKYRRVGMRGIIFALSSGREEVEAHIQSLYADLGTADPREALRARIDAHAKTLPLPAAALATDQGEPTDEYCQDLLTIATVLAKSSGRVYLRDKVPNLDRIAPGRRIVLIVPKQRGNTKRAPLRNASSTASRAAPTPCPRC